MRGGASGEEVGISVGGGGVIADDIDGVFTIVDHEVVIDIDVIVNELFFIESQVFEDQACGHGGVTDIHDANGDGDGAIWADQVVSDLKLEDASFCAVAAVFGDGSEGLCLTVNGDESKVVIGRIVTTLEEVIKGEDITSCLLYTSPSPRDVEETRMPSSA